jgi:hypothetical protein
MNDRMLRAATYYSEHDLPVLPVWPVLTSGSELVCGCGKRGEEDNQKPGKHPLGALVPHGSKQATTDRDTIKRWWRDRPSANIAIAAGRHIILDVDRRHGGVETLATLEQQHGPLPETWRARSPSVGGGPHYFFRCPDGVKIAGKASAIGPGIDVRGEGNYAVAAPSRHIEGGEYVWELWPHNTPLAELPEWIVRLAEKPGGNGQATPIVEWRHLFCDGIDHGIRDDTFPRLAGHLLRRYVDPIIVAQLLLSWNQTHCRPPHPEEKILEIINRIAARELRRREESGK